MSLSSNFLRYAAVLSGEYISTLLTISSITSAFSSTSALSAAPSVSRIAMNLSSAEPTTDEISAQSCSSSVSSFITVNTSGILKRSEAERSSVMPRSGAIVRIASMYCDATCSFTFTEVSFTSML